MQDSALAQVLGCVALALALTAITVFVANAIFDAMGLAT